MARLKCECCGYGNSRIISGSANLIIFQTRSCTYGNLYPLPGNIKEAEKGAGISLSDGTLQAWIPIKKLGYEGETDAQTAKRDEDTKGPWKMGNNS